MPWIMRFRHGMGVKTKYQNIRQSSYCKLSVTAMCLYLLRGGVPSMEPKHRLLLNHFSKCVNFFQQLFLRTTSFRLLCMCLYLLTTAFHSNISKSFTYSFAHLVWNRKVYSFCVHSSSLYWSSLLRNTNQTGLCFCFSWSFDCLRLSIYWQLASTELLLKRSFNTFRLSFSQYGALTWCWLFFVLWKHFLLVNVYLYLLLHPFVGVYFESRVFDNSLPIYDTWAAERFLWYV